MNQVSVSLLTLTFCIYECSATSLNVLSLKENNEATIQQGSLLDNAIAAPSWQLVSFTNEPVIDSSMAAAQGIEDGLEGGRILKDRKGLYHMFPTERMRKGSGIGDGPQPSNLYTRLGHWTSKTPGTPGSWQRVGTIVESTRVYDGSDRKASLFAGMPVFDPADGDKGRWHFFYVAYCEAPMSSGPVAHQHAYVQFDGAIAHAVSEHPGEDGLDGPYTDMGFVLDPRVQGDQDLSWEGDQGDDAFFPYRLPSGKWVAFYGSALSRKQPFSNENKAFNHDWFVGLASFQFPEKSQTSSFLSQSKETLDAHADVATASSLGNSGAQWRKLREHAVNPVMMDAAVENPVVTKTQDGQWYIAVYYPFEPGVVAFSFSKDGLSWSKGTRVEMTPGATPCGPGGLFTALGLVPEPELGRGVYSIMFTGRSTSDQNSFENVCYARVRNVAEGPPNGIITPGE